ncbi:MAG: zinc ABC transporter substrate-binding protein [Theionarchaea archaeon]|nr:zinc ABC transporter substrate-binding protein [Theionarchaea archaeon]MBU7037914.1 zinc ABC transporter substrate-binding protein [Theionarchaea archaeon]
MTKRLLLIVLILSAGCTSGPQPEATGRIGVIVSILPQAEFVEKVGGDRVIVTVMIPPGASPHSYEPAPDQLIQVSTASLYCAVGSGIEFELGWMDRIISMNRDMAVIDCSKGIELISRDHDGDDHGGTNPHVWLSPRNAAIMVENIFQGLVAVDPDSVDYYTENKERYLQELETLDHRIREALPASLTKLIVYHPSWGYFCREYGLEEIPIEKEGKDPTPQDIARLIDLARKEHITVIFVSPQVNRQPAEVIAREIGGKVVLVDPLEKNYVENLFKVAQAFMEV